MQIHEKSKMIERQNFKKSLFRSINFFGNYFFVNMKKRFGKTNPSSSFSIKIMLIGHWVPPFSHNNIESCTGESLMKVCNPRNNKKILYFNSGQ